MSLPAPSVEPLAVAYLRVSAKDQAERGGLAEGLSLPAQRRAIQERARSLGAPIVKEFVDAGESGRSADRPQLQEMLQYLRENRVDLVMVHKIDRLARNRADDVAISLAIRQSGAQLVSVTENVDETPQGQLMHGIFSAFADFYSQNLAQEVTKGQEQKIRNGGSLGRAPVGYVNVRSMINGREARHVEVDQDRADHVRWAFDLYATNPDMTVHRLADLLEDRGFTMRASAKQAERPLQHQQVHRMLTNRYYIGVITYKGVEYPGAHEPLIDEATFQAVQARLEANRNGANRERRHLHYLAGTVYCGRCKSRMTYSVNTGRRGDRYEYYVCSGRQTKATDCTTPHLAVHRVEEAISRLWDGEHAKWSEEAAPRLRHDLVDHLGGLRAESTKDATSLQRRVDKLRRDRNKWADLSFSGTVPEDIARGKQDLLTRQLVALEGELTALEAAGVDTEATLNRLIDLISAPVGHQYRNLEPGLRRTYNQAWFTRIYLDAISPDPELDLASEAVFSPIAAALNGSREYALAEATAETSDAGKPGPPELRLTS